jgi:pimeloyl-ACP methyl ester carboxylesterase
MTSFAIQNVAASDGTVLGVHSAGKGLNILIVHGSMQSGMSHSELAELLCGEFRVHLLDRRGRGASGERAEHPSTQQEVDDLRTVLRATDSSFVFGVSSGGIIAARAALADPAITKLALFEPPLSIDGSISTHLTGKVLAALDRDDLPTAMGLAMKAAEMGPSWMFGLPTPLLALASRSLLRSRDTKRLAYAMRADFVVVRENADRHREFAALSTPTLLIDGGASRPYLRRAVASLADVVLGSTRVTVPGQWHSATGNRADRGHPETIAPLLADFFR